MAVQSTYYSDEGLDSNTFPISKHIASKAHMTVWLLLPQIEGEDEVWELLPASNYDLITNSCVLAAPINTAIYTKMEIRVADTADELLASPSDIAICASIADSIVACANKDVIGGGGGLEPLDYDVRVVVRNDGTADFTSLNDAITSLTKKYTPAYIAGGFKAEIHCEDYILQEQVWFENVDLRWITITAWDTTEQIALMNIDVSFATKMVSEEYTFITDNDTAPVIFVNNSKSPIFAFSVVSFGVVNIAVGQCILFYFYNSDVYFKDTITYEMSITSTVGDCMFSALSNISITAYDFLITMVTNVNRNAVNLYQTKLNCDGGNLFINLNTTTDVEDLIAISIAMSEISVKGLVIESTKSFYVTFLMEESELLVYDEFYINAYNNTNQYSPPAQLVIALSKLVATDVTIINSGLIGGAFLMGYSDFTCGAILIAELNITSTPTKEMAVLFLEASNMSMLHLAIESSGNEGVINLTTSNIRAMWLELISDNQVEKAVILKGGSTVASEGGTWNVGVGGKCNIPALTLTEDGSINRID